MAERFCVSGKQAIAETIEGEAIIIHLGTGAYYSLREAGADIWGAIEQQATRAEIVDLLQASYDGSREEIDAEVNRLIGQLQAEGLVESAAAGERSSQPLTAVATAARKPFAAPILEKHTDMQDLILIDPVHEVEPRGWPYAEADSGR
jgi:hypothetical protein